MTYFTDTGTNVQIIGIATNKVRQRIGTVLGDVRFKMVKMA